MRKTVAKTSTKKETKTVAKRKSGVVGVLKFEVNGNVFELEMSGKVSATGKTIVFRSSKDDYLEQGIGTNIWIDLDLI